MGHMLMNDLIQCFKVKTQLMCEIIPVRKKVIFPANVMRRQQKWSASAQSASSLKDSGDRNRLHSGDLDTRSDLDTQGHRCVRPENLTISVPGGTRNKAAGLNQQPRTGVSKKKGLEAVFKLQRKASPPSGGWWWNRRIRRNRSAL